MCSRILIAICFISVAFAQISFTEHTITDSIGVVNFIFATDIDNDGDMDFLSALFSEGKVAWYENNGSENFEIHIITTAAAGVRSVFAIDVDSDGDIDIFEYDSTIYMANINDFISPDSGIFYLDTLEFVKTNFYWI